MGGTKRKSTPSVTASAAFSSALSPSSFLSWQGVFASIASQPGDVILSRVNKTKSHKVGGEERPEGVETLGEALGAVAEATGRRPSHGGMDRPLILRDSHLPLPRVNPHLHRPWSRPCERRSKSWASEGSTRERWVAEGWEVVGLVGGRAGFGMRGRKKG